MSRERRRVRALVLGVLAVLAGAAFVVVGLRQMRDDGPGSQASGTPPTTVGPALSDTDRTFAFAVVGDFGVGGEAPARVAQQVRRWTQREDGDALLTTGDNVYPDGDPDRFTAAWREPYGWTEDDDVPVVASLGNHDVRDDGGEAVMGLLHMPARWYSERLGDAEVFVLDANRPDDPDQLAWLDEALRASTARWKIALFHQPAFSCSKHGSTSGVVEAWVPQFERHGVDLVLNGHDHNYQRFAAHHGVTYVVTGAGGADLYAIERCRQGEPGHVVADDDAHSFVTVEGSDRALHLEARTDAGDVIDRLALRQD